MVGMPNMYSSSSCGPCHWGYSSKPKRPVTKWALWLFFAFFQFYCGKVRYGTLLESEWTSEPAPLVNVRGHSLLVRIHIVGGLRSVEKFGCFLGCFFRFFLSTNSGKMIMANFGLQSRSRIPTPCSRVLMYCMRHLSCEGPLAHNIVGVSKGANCSKLHC